MERVGISHDVRLLETLFVQLNKMYFGGLLPSPVLTFSPDVTGKSLGHCSIKQVWHDSREGLSPDAYEINICPEGYGKGEEGFYKVCEIMLHEMVHLRNIVDNVKDTTRNGFYHNKAYKAGCDRIGLLCDFNKKYGWCETSLSDDMRERLKPLCKYALSWFRDGYNKKEVVRKKSHSIKYTCPKCECSVRSTKPVKILCYDCNQVMTV